MTRKIIAIAFLFPGSFLSMGNRGCETKVDPGPGSIIPPIECTIPEEMSDPRPWNVDAGVEGPVCSYSGYELPCSCEEYGGTYPENIFDGSEAYGLSDFDSCKPHRPSVQPLLKYALPGCALYVQLDGTHSHWHRFNPGDDDQTFDVCPERQRGFAYFGDFPTWYFLPEIRSDGNFRFNYIYDEDRHTFSRPLGSMHVELQGCRYFDGLYYLNDWEIVRGPRLGLSSMDTTDNGVHVSVIGDWVVDAGKGGDEEHDEWAEIHEARGIVVRRESTEEQKYYLVANIFFSDETLMSDDYWMYIPVPPHPEPGMNDLHCENISPELLRPFRFIAEPVPWSCITNPGAELVEVRDYVSEDENRYECQLHFSRCAEPDPGMCSQPNEWKCGNACGGNDFNTGEDCDTIFWSGIIEAYWTDPGDVWLCNDCLCEDLAVAGAYFAAPVQGCAMEGLDPANASDQFEACQQVCSGERDEVSGELKSSGTICGASVDCRIGGCFPPSTPRMGMAELVGEHACDPNVKPSPDSLRVSRTGDYRVTLLPRDSDSEEGSFAYMRLEEHETEASVSGQFFFNVLWSGDEWGEGAGIVEFSNADTIPADFSIEDIHVSGGSIFTVSRVQGPFIPDSIGDFVIGSGWGVFGVRGYDGDTLYGFEVRNPEDIAGSIGNIEEGARTFRMDVHATELETEEEEKELHAFLVGVIDNVKPVAEAGLDVRHVECASFTTTPVLLDGRLSQDIDPGDAISHYQWFAWSWEEEKFVGLSNDDVTAVSLPLGEHAFALHVYDMKLGADRDDTTIVVEDTTPPELEVQPVDVCLWPPNHKFARFELGQEIQSLVQDVCDPDPSLKIVGVTSSEPDDGLGDGLTTGDIRWGPDAACVKLRVERSGTGEGRVYVIRIEARDHTGDNASYADVVVRVPHDHEEGCLAVQTYDEDDPACIF